jgi:DNA-binding HxlR family transcriptional regulator
VLPRSYDNQNCSIARALELVGDRWTILVIREAFLGTRRFDDYQRNLGCARNVLTDRLNRLVDAGILRKVPYQDRPPRHEYRLTRRGVQLWPATMALMKWGDRHLAPDGPPTLVLHKGCDGELDERLHCGRCGTELEPNEVYAVSGPGMHGAEADARSSVPAASLGSRR